MNTLTSLSAAKGLRSTWVDLWKRIHNQSSAGVDGVTPSQFNAMSEGQISAVRHELLTGYNFQPLLPYSFPKVGTDKYRIICIPTVKDRLVQRHIGDHLSAIAPRMKIINDASYGFVKSDEKTDRGVIPARKRAASLRSKAPWAYKSDISAYFDSIDRSLLFDEVRRAVRTPSLNSILKAAIECEAQPQSKRDRRLVDKAGIVQGRGVRQGMPLSPFFANIMLRNFDRVLLNKGFKLVRYADDFLILCDSEAACWDADGIIRDILGDIGLVVPAVGDPGGKTQICDPSTAVEFLGLSMQRNKDGKYVLLITDTQLNRITAELSVFSDIDFLHKQSISIIELTKHVSNKISGYYSSYKMADNFGVLQRKLEKAQSEMLSKIFVGMFGSGALSKLSSKERKFLRLD